VFYWEKHQGDVLWGMTASLPVEGSFIWAIVENLKEL